MRFKKDLGGGFIWVFIFIPILGEDFQFDGRAYFSDGWPKTTNQGLKRWKFCSNGGIVNLDCFGSLLRGSGYLGYVDSNQGYNPF